MTRLFTLPMVLALLASCQSRPDTPAGQADSVTDSSFSTTDSAMAEVDSGLASGEWSLVALGGQPAPTGAGDRPATLVFAPGTNQVGGFSGCNRAGGTYVIKGDSIQFSPMVMTRMACDKGMELEQRFVAMVDSARTWRRRADTLELMGAAGTVIARLERRPT
ncbi:MAG TPA: META domain-containing protein [Gemmatimonadales bacterium]|nr:META domain-containing protein [Gemmatimonadales bacterium]